MFDFNTNAQLLKALYKAKEAGRNTSAAEKLLRTAEGFIRSGNHRIGATYIRKAMEALGERPAGDGQ